MLLTQCFQNLFEHEIFFFFPRKMCLTDFRNVWSESTSVIGITWTCVQTVAPNPRLCTLSSLQIRGKHCCWGQCRKGWGTDRSPLTPATSDKRTCLSVLSTAVMNTTTKSSLGGGEELFQLTMLWSHSITEGRKQRQEPECKNWSRVHGWMLLPTAGSICFLKLHRTTSPGGRLPRVHWALHSSHWNAL